jgi:hypothetical protein
MIASSIRECRIPCKLLAMETGHLPGVRIRRTDVRGLLDHMESDSTANALYSVVTKQHHGSRTSAYVGNPSIATAHELQTSRFARVHPAIAHVTLARGLPFEADEQMNWRLTNGHAQCDRVLSSEELARCVNRRRSADGGFRIAALDIS